MPIHANKSNRRALEPGTAADHLMIGEYIDDAVIYIGTQGAVARPERLSEMTGAWTDFDAADEHVVASDADQPRVSVGRRASEGVETVVELSRPPAQLGARRGHAERQVSASMLTDGEQLFGNGPSWGHALRRDRWS